MFVFVSSSLTKLMNFGQACFVDFSLSPAHIYGAICIVIVIDISDFYLHHSFTRVHFLHVCFLPLSVSSCDQAFSTSNCRAFIYWCLRLFSACFSACLTDHTCHGFCTCITCLLICRVSIYINIYLYQHLSISPRWEVLRICKCFVCQFSHFTKSTEIHDLV